MVPSFARPVTQKKPTSVMPTLSAAPIRWASCTGSLPVERRLRAPAVAAAATPCPTGVVGGTGAAGGGVGGGPSGIAGPDGDPGVGAGVTGAAPAPAAGPWAAGA